MGSSTRHPMKALRVIILEFLSRDTKPTLHLSGLSACTASTCRRLGYGKSVQDVV